MHASYDWHLQDARQLPRLAQDWDLLNHHGAASPLLDTAFVLPLLSAFGNGTEILASCRMDGRYVGMLLITSHRFGFAIQTWQTFQPSQAPLGLGVWEDGLDWPACLSALLRKLPGISVLLGLTQQDPFVAPRPSDQTSLRTLDYMQTARIVMEGSFDDYWASRGKNLKQNLKKQRLKLARDGVATRLEIITAVDQVKSAVADYARLESAGWKAASGTAVSDNSGQVYFYQEMLENFCRKGQGRIYRYWYGEEVAAMDLCVTGADHIIILKTTYNEQLAAGTSPALLMRQEAMATLFCEAGLNRIEFYGKLLEWHTRWSDDIRTMYHLNVYRWPVLAQCQQGLRKFQQRWLHV
jgi:CelD/BcsL family acetyltransferase involved in cellulose biosynthesis